jgi:ASC-1-like (ASCH) protein
MPSRKKSRKKSKKSKPTKVKPTKSKPTKVKYEAPLKNSTANTYFINLQLDHFDNVVLGKKTVEGRLNKNKFKEMKIGDILIINNLYETKITGIAKYKTFTAFLTKEKIQKALPGVKNVKKGTEIYRRYYDDASEKEFGVVAIRLGKGKLLATIGGKKRSRKNRSRKKS